MLVIGLTGGIGSGKSQVAKAFAAKAIDIINADALARDVVLPGTAALSDIHQHFGDDVLHPNGELNRQALRQHIFRNPAEKAWLEQRLHPEIRTAMATAIAAAQSPYVVCEIPLLVETGPNPLVDRILVVDVPLELQRERTMQRDNITASEVNAIMAHQVTREQRLAAADDVIDNSGSFAVTEQQVDQLHEKYLKLGK